MTVPVLGTAAVYMIYAYSRPGNGTSAGTSASLAVASSHSSEIAELAETLGTVDIFHGLPASELVSLAVLGRVRTANDGEVLCTEGHPGSLLHVVLDDRASLTVDSPDGPLPVRIVGPGESFPSAELGAVRTVREGEGLGDEGQVGDSVYVVLEGRAHLSANSSIGRLTARVAGPGESFPLAALLGDGRLITTARAQTKMRVWQVDRSALNHFFGDHPEIACHVYEKAATVLALRYRSTVGRLSQMVGRPGAGEGLWVNT